MPRVAVTGRAYQIRGELLHAGAGIPLTKPAAEPIRARSLGEIRKHPELLIAPDVVVPGLAWKERISLMAATEGLGKSTLFAEAANAVATGTPFLDALRTVQGRVLWVLSEEHLVDVNRRALALDPERVGGEDI